MKAETSLRRIFERHFRTDDRDMDEAAVEAAMDIYRLFSVAMRIYTRDTLDDDLRQDILRSLFTQAVALPNNRFWMTWGSELRPVLVNAMNIWALAPQYMADALEERDDSRSAYLRAQLLQVQTSFVDVIMAMAFRGMKDFYQNARQLRDDVMQFTSQHYFDIESGQE